MLKTPAKLKLKKEAYINEMVRNGMNGKRAMMKLNPNITPQSAEVASSRMLRDDKVRLSIAERLTGINVEPYLHRNIKQRKNYSASNQALDIYYKLTGDYAPDRRTTLNVDVTLPTDPEALRELLELQAQALAKLLGNEANTPALPQNAPITHDTSQDDTTPPPKHRTSV